jgi:hypothetical protein
MKKTNPFRPENARTWANACVGNNGNPGIWDYTSGYIQSAELIIDAVLNGHGISPPVDTMVYPVCFGLRHALELAIKAGAIAISEIAHIKKIQTHGLSENSHNICDIWKRFKADCKTLDSRLFNITKPMDPVVSIMGEVDPTGQTFRYPTSNESQKHLTDVAIINFHKLKEISTVIKNFTKIIEKASKELVHEYTLGTFTANLSRADIHDISLRLPAHENWKNSKFSNTKEAIINKYSISNSEFSKAVNLIKSHYEFSQNIEIRTPLMGAKYHHIGRFIYWAVVSQSAGRTQDGNNEHTIFSNFDAFKDWSKRDSNTQIAAWNDFSKIVTPEAQADISSLYYFSSCLDDYSEEYIQRYNSTLKALKTGYLEEPFLHILRKTDSALLIIKSLNFLGHKELSDRLMKCYGLKITIHS